jgi:hypothetical protein
MRTLAEIVPLRTVACREAVDAVAQIAAGEEGVAAAAATHVATCLRCQAEVAAFRRILRTMRSMRHDVLGGSTDSLAEALEVLHTAAGPTPAGSNSQLGGSGHAGRRDQAEEATSASWALRAACVGGITAASAAGVLFWFSLRRPGLAHAS